MFGSLLVHFSLIYSQICLLGVFSLVLSDALFVSTLGTTRAATIQTAAIMLQEPKRDIVYHSIV
jgi:hypothetical protein